MEVLLYKLTCMEFSEDNLEAIVLLEDVALEEHGQGAAGCLVPASWHIVTTQTSLQT